MHGATNLKGNNMSTFFGPLAIIAVVGILIYLLVRNSRHDSSKTPPVPVDPNADPVEQAAQPTDREP